MLTPSTVQLVAHDKTSTDSQPLNRNSLVPCYNTEADIHNSRTVIREIPVEPGGNSVNIPISYVLKWHILADASREKSSLATDRRFRATWKLE